MSRHVRRADLSLVQIMQSTIIVPMESSGATRPIIELDIDNDPNVVSMAKALGYLYISRSSALGEIPSDKALKLLAEELFDLSLANKIALGSDYVRSMDFNEPPLKKELITFKSSSPMNGLSQSIHIRILFGICQQISMHLGDLLDLPSPSSPPSDAILFNHYFPTAEPLLINRNTLASVSSLFDMYLAATELQRTSMANHRTSIGSDRSHSCDTAGLHPSILTGSIVGEVRELHGELSLVQQQGSRRRRIVLSQSQSECHTALCDILLSVCDARHTRWVLNNGTG
jgi:hypothetical protein